MKNDIAYVAALKELINITNLKEPDQGNQNKDDSAPKKRLMEMLKKKMVC